MSVMSPGRRRYGSMRCAPKTLSPAQVYWRNEHPRFPDGGKLSQFMEALPIGGEMEFKGPLGHFVYLGRGRCFWLQRRSQKKKLCAGLLWSCLQPSLPALVGVLPVDAPAETVLSCGLAWLWADMGVRDAACRGSGMSSMARARHWSGCP